MNNKDTGDIISESKYKHLVLSGGGGFSLCQIAALYKCIGKNIIRVDNIQTIFSTSAGALSGIIFSLRLDEDLTLNYFLERPWYKIFEPITPNIFNIYDEKGMYYKDPFIKLLTPLFSFKNLDIDISLKDFYIATNITQYMYTTCLDTLETLELSHITHPDMPLIDALYMTCSFPYIFKPEKYNERIYVDGGVFLNYPIENCLNKNENEPHSIFAITLSKYNTINDGSNNTGIKHATPIYDYSTYANMNIVQYSFTFMYSIINRLNKNEKRDLYEKYKSDITEISIPMSSFETMSYKIVKHKEIRTKYINLGFEYAEKVVESMKSTI